MTRFEAILIISIFFVSSSFAMPPMRGAQGGEVNRKSYGSTDTEQQQRNRLLSNRDDEEIKQSEEEVEGGSRVVDTGESLSSIEGEEIDDKTSSLESSLAPLVKTQRQASLFQQAVALHSVHKMTSLVHAGSSETSNENHAQANRSALRSSGSDLRNIIHVDAPSSEPLLASLLKRVPSRLNPIETKSLEDVLKSWSYNAEILYDSTKKTYRSYQEESTGLLGTVVRMLSRSQDERNQSREVFEVIAHERGTDEATYYKKKFALRRRLGEPLTPFLILIAQDGWQPSQQQNRTSFVSSLVNTVEGVASYWQGPPQKQRYYPIVDTAGK